jgi:hypothetical protein
MPMPTLPSVLGRGAWWLWRRARPRANLIAWAQTGIVDPYRWGIT